MTKIHPDHKAALIDFWRVRLVGFIFFLLGLIMVSTFSKKLKTLEESIQGYNEKK